MSRFYEPTDRPRRFYAKAQAAPAKRGFAVLLDGRTPRSTSGTALILPTLPLAELVAGEWAAQGNEILFPLMPATRLAWTALERIPAARRETAADIARFAETDALCYFADGPAALIQRQADRWAPVLSWAERVLSVELRRVQGVLHQPQPPAAIERIEALVAAEDDFVLVGLAFGAALFGSAVLAFAVRHGELSGEAAFDLSRLEEAFHEDRWGIDAEAAERTAAMAKEAIVLERWFASLEPARYAAPQLARLGGTSPGLKLPRRRRSGAKPV